jgi:hypothetical protein
VNTANTPEQIYWGQKEFRETLAKTAQVRSSSVYYKDVLPNRDDLGNPIATVSEKGSPAELLENEMGTAYDKKRGKNGRVVLSLILVIHLAGGQLRERGKSCGNCQDYTYYCYLSIHLLCYTLPKAGRRDA